MLQARKVGAGIPPEAKNRLDATQEAVVRSRRNCIFTGSALLAVLAVVSLGARTTRAQTTEIATRLPARTVAFVEWRGTTAVSGAAQQNHVLQMMADPGLAPLWLGLAANFQKAQQSNPSPASPLSLPEVVSLLQNPGVAGFIETTHGAAPPSTAEPVSPIAMFLVYDATGKTEIIHKLEATGTSGPSAHVVTHFDFNGTTVEARTVKESTTYFATAGHYFVSSDTKAVIEDFITRYGAASNPVDSLTNRPEYTEAKKFIGSDAAVDYFARMPNVKAWISAGAKNKEAALKFMDGLHLEKVHAMGGSVSFAGEAVHMRGAILGDTQPVGPFDFAGASSASFRTLGIAAGAPEFTVSRVNIGAAYRLMIDAIGAVLPPQQAASIQASQGMAQGFLGMPLPEALDLFTGELASASSFSADGTQARVFAATIQKPDAVLHILRAVLGPMTLAEDSFGSTTMLDIAYPYRDPLTGFQRRKMYYVAVTPQMLLVAPQKKMLRDTIEGLQPAGKTAAPSVKGLFDEPEYLKMRAQLPANLSGLGAEDLAQIPWDAIWANFEQQLEQGSKRLPHPSKTAYSPDYSWMRLVNPNVIPRHLHMAVSGWWKDASGVYFDSYVQ